MADIQTTEETSLSLSSGSSNLRVKILCKTIFFIMYAIMVTIDSYQNIFLVSIGFTISQAGNVTALCFIASLIAGPCWGTLADKTGYRKTIFPILSLVVLFTFFPLPLIARELQNSQSLSNLSHPTRINNTLNFISENPIPEQSAVQSLMFFNIIAAILITGHTCLYTMVSFVDSTTMIVLQTLQLEEGYGEQRIFGALGTGVTVMLCGYVADNFKHPTLSKYIGIYFVLLPYMMIGLPLTLLLFRYANWKKTSKTNGNNQVLSKKYQNSSQNEKTSNLSDSSKSDEETIINSSKTLKPRSQKKILKEIFSETDNVFLMATTLVIGTIRAIFFSFLFVFLKKEMNGSKTMGICMFVNSTSAFIMFFYTKRLINFLGGTFISISIGIFTWAVRLLITSFITNQWLFALPQILQSFSFALYWSALVQHVHETAPKEIYITMFTLLIGLNFGGAGFLANVIGGTIYKMYGGRVLFRGCAVVAFCWLIFTLTYHCRTIITKKVCGNKKWKRDDDNDAMKTENV